MAAAAAAGGLGAVRGAAEGRLEPGADRGTGEAGRRCGGERDMALRVDPGGSRERRQAVPAPAAARQAAQGEGIMSNQTPESRDSVQVAESAHRRAMELVDAAFLARRSGDTQRERAYNLQALEKERQAADAIAERFDLEPSRSVLYRSAATLAYRCGKLREAQRLVTCALSSKLVPSEIAQELRDLEEEINCRKDHGPHGMEW